MPWFCTSQNRIYKSSQSSRKQSKLDQKGDRFYVKTDSSLAALQISMSMHGNIDFYLLQDNLKGRNTGERQVGNCVNTLMQNDGKCLTNQ